MASSLVLTRIIVCAVACAIAITSRPTTGQSLYMTALTGSTFFIPMQYDSRYVAVCSMIAGTLAVIG